MVTCITDDNIYYTKLSKYTFTCVHLDINFQYAKPVFTLKGSVLDPWLTVLMRGCIHTWVHDGLDFWYDN